jgi:hypothetical protein
MSACCKIQEDGYKKTMKGLSSDLDQGYVQQKQNTSGVLQASKIWDFQTS